MSSSAKRSSILLDSIGTVKSDVSCDETLICVTTDGFVYYFPVKKGLQEYLFNTSTNVPSLIPSILKRHPNVFPDPRLCITDILAFTPNLKPQCVGKFDPISDKTMMSAEVSFDKKLLMIKGCVVDDVPCFCIFSLKQFSMEMIYSEPIIGVIDMCFHSTNLNVLALPRCLNGIISQIAFPSTLPEHFNHRVIPQMTFLGHSSKRSHHITASPTSAHHQFATWSDEEIPQISLWRIALDGQILRWFETTMQFTIPLFIQNLCFDSNGDRIGAVMSTEEYTSISIWELKKDQNRQNSFCIPEHMLGEVITTKWGPTFNEDSESFYVLTTTALFMHKGTGVMMWAQPDVKMTNFYVSDMFSIFYSNENGELRLISPHEGNPTGGAVTLQLKKPSSIPFIKATTKGDCDLVFPVHLHRCANCRMPLIQPLICRDNGLECCYCSRECQEQHWPMYVAVHKPVPFEAELRNAFVVPVLSSIAKKK